MHIIGYTTTCKYKCNYCLNVEADQYKTRVTHKKFDACHFANMLPEALCMSSTVIPNWENMYFQDFLNQHPVNNPYQDLPVKISRDAN